MAVRADWPFCVGVTFFVPGGEFCDTLRALVMPGPLPHLLLESGRRFSDREESTPNA